MEINVSPSILSADFSCLADELKKIKAAGADLIHVDVMDGHFVPNITIGPVVIKDIKRHTDLPLDVHLMIEKPQDLLDSFVNAGSDMITLHIETIDVSGFKFQVSRLKAKGIKVGVSLNPGTELEKIKELLGAVDFVLVMSVNPGFSGQEFIPEVLPKIRQLRSLFKGDISLDGGINEKTAQDVVRAGANILVAGSYIFKSKDYGEVIRRLKCAK
jgi:ribulose-phosphate 3-epimerase